MSDHDTDTSAVLDTLRDALNDVTMNTPAEQIVAAGRARRRRRYAVGAAGVAAVTGLALGWTAYAQPGTTGNAAGGVHLHTVAYTLDTQKDGTVRVTWDKQRYFTDHDGLEAALRAAGFPVQIKEGEFCRGPQDTATTDPSGVGAGVTKVMRGVRGNDGKVTFIFTPAAMPPGKELFIGYLTPAQLAVTSGNPGSVERLVPTGVPLTCTTEAPPGHPRPPAGVSKK